MKKKGKIFYSILVTFIVIIIGFGIYFVSASPQNKEDINGKILSELDYVEETLVKFFNQMNNIEYENYKLSVQTIDKGETTEKEGQSNTSNEGSDSKSSGDNQENSNEEDQSSSSSQESSGEAKSGTTDTSNTSQSSSSQGNSSDSQKFVLESTGVLTESRDIEWSKVKIQVENLYVSIPTITLDLYQTSNSKEDILNFSTDIDNLVVAMKNENKEETLAQLVKLYEYMPKFIKNVKADELKSIEYDTKYQILKAYSKLDSGDWQSMASDIDGAIQIFTEVITSVNNENKQYNLNKTYVMLQEMKNAVDKQDTEIFLIKYKNLVEELNNL